MLRRTIVLETDIRMGYAGRYYTLPHFIVYSYRDYFPLSFL